jgi:outer membrane protein TolC
MTRTVLVAALVAASATAARAQDTRRLTLPDVLAQARKSNRDLKTARTRLDQAAISVDQAWVALYPQAVAQGKFTHNYKEVAIDPSSFGGGSGGGMMGAPSSPIVIQRGEQLDGTATVTVPLLVPWAYPGLSAARASYRSAEATYGLSETTVLVAAAQTFYQAAGADEVLRARHSAVEVARQGWNDARVRFSAGTVTTVDVARAELALVRAQQAERDADYGRAQAYRALGTIAQVDGPFAVAPGEVTPAAVNAADVDGALHLRPELAALEASLQAAAAQERASGWRWAPSLSAFGTGRVSNYSGFGGDPYFWAVGASLDWVLFDGGLRDVQRRTAHAQGRETTERILALRDTVRDDLANARLLLDTKRAAVESARKSVELARATLDLVRVQYESGATTQLALLEAQDNLVAADVGLAQARFELAIADLGARRAAGTFPEH